MKYLLLFILGFIAHKGSEEVYEYHFDKAFRSKLCVEQYIKDREDENVEAPLTERFKCTYDNMGPSVHLRYILLRPHWFINDGKTWYY